MKPPDSPYTPILTSDSFRIYSEELAGDREEKRQLKEVWEDEWLAGGDR